MTQRNKSWNKDSVRKIIREEYSDYSFVIVANREPYLHTFDENGKIISTQSVGGVSVTFDSVMRATKGTWIAYGGSNADKETVDKSDHIKVPPGNPKYTLRRIWMTKEERLGYYEGLSNETLWPLCHITFIRPKFSDSDWQMYKKINKRFAKAVLEEIKGKKAVVWIQDYHYSLLAKYIKESRPDVVVAQFWHIPWPTYEIFRICPWKKDILNGLLHNDLLGFHRNYQVTNFLDNVTRELESKVDREDLIVRYKNKNIKVGSFPIGVDFDELSGEMEGVKIEEAEKSVKKYVTCPYEILALGVDRIDYTKGIPNRLLAIERFLDKNPHYRGKFVYLGIGSPSRTGIETYKTLGKEIKREVERINKRFKTDKWQPIFYINKPVDRKKLMHFFSIANLCLVTPLDDGMNLVSKEYVAINNGQGALLLSEFVGAARDLKDAFLINPYDVKGMASAIKTAIESPLSDRVDRMKKMKKTVSDRNVYHWIAEFLLELAKIKK